MEKRSEKNLASCGENVWFGRGCLIYPKKLHIGNNVSIGPNANITSTIASIFIGNNVMLAPNVTIRGGDHRIDIVGRYMIDVKASEKLPENDKDVIIEDDVWIGTNVTILKGVRIGRGSVIGAGAVVTKNVLPYSIYAGVPAKKIKERFTLDEIKLHEQILYGENNLKDNLK